MKDQPRYATLRDYLRVVRQQRWLIIIVTLVFAGAALAYSLQQKPTYQAETSLLFNDPASDADLVGASALPTQSPEQRSATAAETITRPAVVRDVRRQLKTRASVEEITKQVSAKPEALTNLVVIQAKAENPKFAAALANAFAAEVVKVSTKAEHERFKQIAVAMRRAYGRQRRNTNAFSRAMVAERISRVEALARSAQPVEVTKRGEVPKTPVGPRPLRNTVLGGLIGLVLALLISFIRDSLDRRLRGAREIQEELELPLLGHVSVDTMGRSLVSNNGHKIMTEADLEAFRVLRTNLEFLDVDNPARVVLVTSGLPGEGKSTVSSALATTSALAGKRTLLVECDLRRPQIAERFGLGDGPGLSDYLAGRVEPKDVLRKIVLAPAPSRNGDGADPEPDPSAPSLVCITAGAPPPRPAEMLGSQKFASFLAEVREAYDFVVLDSSPLLSVSDTLKLLPRVDGVILCVRASQTTQEQARAAKAAIENLPDRPTGLVVTGVKKGESEDYGYYSYAYGRK